MWRKIRPCVNYENYGIYGQLSEQFVLRMKSFLAIAHPWHFDIRMEKWGQPISQMWQTGRKWAIQTYQQINLTKFDHQIYLSLLAALMTEKSNGLIFLKAGILSRQIELVLHLLFNNTEKKICEIIDLPKLVPRNTINLWIWILLI